MKTASDRRGMRAARARRRPDPTAPPAWVRLPEGTACYVAEDAARKTHVESVLRRVFEGWGYGEAVTPTFDDAEQLAVGLGGELRERMMRLADGAPRSLALRVDLTTPIARLVATRLREAPRPIRLFYVENVFRRQEAHRGRRREFCQAGVEHFGTSGVEADAEVLLVATEALHSLGLTGFQVNLGHLGLVRATLDSLELSPRSRAEALAAIDRKDESELDAVLREARAPRAASAALRRLAGLVGRAEALRAARSLRFLPGARTALARLDALWGWISDAGLDSRVVLDFGEVRGMDYYTGINFEIFAAGAGEALGAGGRYDTLLGHFDMDLPAVGCAFTVEALMGWLERAGARLPERTRTVVRMGTDRAAALREAASVRARGGVAVLEAASAPRRRAPGRRARADTAAGPGRLPRKAGR